MDAPSRYIYGRHPVLEALSAQPQDLRALYLQGPGPHQMPRQAKHPRAAHPDDGCAKAQQLAEAHGIAVRFVARAALERMVGGQAVHQGMVLEAAPFAYAELSSLTAPAHAAALLVVLDQLQDPHNVGAIARSALALGAHGLIIGKDRSADITPTAIKAAAGATAHLPIARVTNISRTLVALKKQGLWIVGTHTGAEAQQLQRVDFTLPTALVIGSEGTGMRPLTAKHCDVLTHIPMATIGSLNASAAAAICLYEAARQRMALL